MSTPDDRCSVCDRPNGWENNPHPDGPPDGWGCELPCCASLCWDGPSGPQCESGRVDWRARHLAWKWHEVMWEALPGALPVRVFASVDGEAVSVGVVQGVFGALLDLGEFSSAERFSLYEALRKHAEAERTREGS